MGNLFDDPDRKLRKYLQGGKIEQSGEWRFKYDKDGQLIEKYKGSGKWWDSKRERWQYEWNQNGSLKAVKSPHRKRPVQFTYDAFSRLCSLSLGLCCQGENRRDVRKTATVFSGMENQVKRQIRINITNSPQAWGPPSLRGRTKENLTHFRTLPVFHGFVVEDADLLDRGDDGRQFTEMLLCGLILCNNLERLA